MASVLLLAAGLLGVLLSVILGQVKIYFILIIPVFVMEGILPILSVLFLIGGAIGIFIGRLSSYTDSEGFSKSGKNIDGGGIIFLGPIPIVFGSRKFREDLPRRIWLWTMGFAIFVILIIAIVLISVFS